MPFSGRASRASGTGSSFHLNQPRHTECPLPSHGHPVVREDSVFRKRPRANSADGCGIFWRRSKFELVASEASEENPWKVKKNKIKVIHDEFYDLSFG